MNKKYHHRRLGSIEFRVLMHRAGLSLNDFLFLTGRRVTQVKPFLDGAENPTWTPTMGDVMLLELCARTKSARARMIEIANEYSTSTERRSD